MGVLDRLILSDDQWERIAPQVIGDERTRGSSGRDNRMFVEAVLWIVRTGSPGAICRRCSASGIAYSVASAAGARRASGGASSRRCRTTPTSNT